MALLTKQDLHKYADKRISELSADQTIQRTPLEKSAVQQALLQQVTQYISQYTPEPRIISYAPNASGDVMGKFASQGRVFSFRLSNKGLVYKPVVQRKDNESEQDFALRFDTGSDILLEQYNLDRTDAAKAYKPKPTVSVPTKRGTKQNPNCSAVSYHCGVCISLGKNCIKNATTAALKERLQKINSLSKMAARGEAVPQVKTGVIGAKVDPKSLTKKAQAQAREFAKSQDKAIAPKEYEFLTGKKKPSDRDLAELNNKDNRFTTMIAREIYASGDQNLIQKWSGRKKISSGFDTSIQKAILKDHDEFREKNNVPSGMSLGDWKAEQDKKAPLHPADQKRLSELNDEIKALTSKKEISHAERERVTHLVDQRKDILSGKTQNTRDRQLALRAAAEPNKTTTLATPYALTAQAQKRLERGESVTDYDTYSISKVGDKYRVTDPQSDDTDGKLVDKAGLAAHLKELESRPRGAKASGSMNPAIPMSKDPDTMLRALRNGRLIGDAKQGYEIQEHPTEKGSYLMTTMPNKKGDYSGVMSRKELVDFVKGGGDASRFNKASTPDQQVAELNNKIKALTSKKEMSHAERERVADLVDQRQEILNTKKESNYVPLSTTKGMSSDRIKGNRNANQIAIDRTKKDVANATARINKLDENIKKLKAGKGVMSEADLKRVAGLERQKGEWEAKRAGHKEKLGDLAKVNEPEPKTLATDKPQTQGTGETEAERRQFLLNTNTESSRKAAEPKREIELADVKTPQDHVKYATQELAIAKASKDPERINKWIDELQRAKKRTMAQAQVSANTYQPDLFFVNKGNPAQRSIFDRADAEYDDSVERNILTNIGLMVSRAISGNQTSPNSVQLRKVKYDGGKVSGIFTQYGSQYDFEINSKGIVISPLQVRQDRLANVPYAKTKNVGANRKCGRGYKCKGTCISKNNKCRVIWASKEGLEQFKSMQSELNDLVSAKFIEINGRQVAQQRSPEGDAKALALAKRLSEARGARKEFAADSKAKTAKTYKHISDRVTAEVERRLKESGFNVKQVKSTLAELDPKDISVDPKRFQYKITGEHTASGTVGSLQGVGTWDENLAGILQVWKDPADGKTYVVNGHNRLHKANELGAEKVAVRYLDVPTHQDARTIGAMTNIAEGHGTALDAAKFFRDTNWTKEDVIKKGIPLKEKIATDGLAIASLEPNLFRQVIDGELPMERATIIGGSGLDHAKQKSLVELLDKRKNVNNATLAELVDTVKYAGQKQEQQFDLFGNSTETVDLAVHRASVQAFVKQKLASEKKLFGTVSKSKSAKDLERGGNQIDVDQSSKIAEEAASALKIFDTIKHNVGGVSTALNSASERLSNAKNKSEQDKIKRETYDLILKEVQSENDKLFKGTKRSDSRQRGYSSHFGQSSAKTNRLDACGCIPTPDSDRILTYVTDNSGNMMGIVQMHGVKYRFLKPVYGDTVLTPISETNLAYLFDLAPDLSLPSPDRDMGYLLESSINADSLKKKPVMTASL